MPDAADEKAISTASNRLIKRHFRLVWFLDPYGLDDSQQKSALAAAVTLLIERLLLE